MPAAAEGLAGRPVATGTWLSAAALAIGLHLGALSLFWTLPFPAVPAGQGQALRISLAAPDRGVAVTLAAPPPVAAPQFPDSARVASARVDSARVASARVASARADSAAAFPAPVPTLPPPEEPAAVPTPFPPARLPPDPAPMTELRAQGGIPVDPAPLPRQRPSHLQRPDMSPLPPVRQPSRTPSQGSSISGLTPAPDAAPVAGGAAPSAYRPSGARERNLLDLYLARLQGILQRNKRYPAAALAARQHGVVLVGFNVERDGRVWGGRVLRSSGHASLDGEALDLLRRVAPLPPLPTGVAAARLDLNVPIRFDRSGGPQGADPSGTEPPGTEPRPLLGGGR